MDITTQTNPRATEAPRERPSSENMCAHSQEQKRPRRGALKGVTVEMLRPLWERVDIPTQRIADTLGVSRQALSLHAAKLGLPKRTGNQRPYKRSDDELFTRMWLSGVTSTEMARRLGYSHRSAISRRRKMLGLPPRHRSAGETGNRGGWGGTISASEYGEATLAKLMMADAERMGARK